MFVNIVTGFLGSGKTTLIRHLARQLAPRERVAVLVGEYGEVGVDGLLLAGDLPGVVELNSKCIYCTMNADLAAEIARIKRTMEPQRLIVEYPGVAAVQGLLAALRMADLPVPQFNIIHVVDAAAFGLWYSQSPRFIGSQVGRADVLVLNKGEEVPPEELDRLVKTLRRLNPHAPLLTGPLEGLDAAQLSAVGRKSRRRSWSAQDIPGFFSFAQRFRGIFAAQQLLGFLKKINASCFGQVVRAKGIFCCEDGWVHMDYLPSAASIKPLEGQYAESRVLVIGPTLAMGRLASAVLKCLRQNECLEEEDWRTFHCTG